MTHPLDPRDDDIDAQIDDQIDAQMDAQMSDGANALDGGSIAHLLRLDAVWDSDEPAGSLPTADEIVAAIRRESQADERLLMDRRPPTRSRQRAGALRRRLEPIALGVAAAAIAIASYSIIDDGDSPATEAIPGTIPGTITGDFVVAMTPPAGAPSSTATAEVSDLALGTWIRLDVVGLPPAEPGTYYEAWMNRQSGSNVSAGTFHMRGGDGQIILWAGVTTDDYPTLLITVQNEGVAERSDEVVLQARIDPSSSGG